MPSVHCVCDDPAFSLSLSNPVFFSCSLSFLVVADLALQIGHSFETAGARSHTELDKRRLLISSQRPSIFPSGIMGRTDEPSKISSVR